MQCMRWVVAALVLTCCGGQIVALAEGGFDGSVGIDAGIDADAPCVAAGRKPLCIDNDSCSGQALCIDAGWYCRSAIDPTCHGFKDGGR